MYVKHNRGEILVVSLYVDELLITGSSEKLLDEFKKDMMDAFEMSDLGPMTYFLGMEITQRKDEFFAAKEFVMHKSNHHLWSQVQKSQPVKLCGYSDSDWGRSEDDAKRTSGCKKQDIIAQSTTEAEFVATVAAAHQALGMKKILVSFHMESTQNIKVFLDNGVAVAISHNLVFHGRTKNFKIKFIFLRELQKDGYITLVYCKTEEQFADILTNPLPISKVQFLK
ncbi:uncharacterized protein LOC114074248 [Solanum pennellii]|uniref:Uncharacterized protein LOC114074248 n=1 Tax=Solanum pennellii TaxID=28526 RepID=A0ABM1UWP9_SOLPN|nr:uncharacterized protein LOC114074248 [Solanum pennellii]